MQYVGDLVGSYVGVWRIKLARVLVHLVLRSILWKVDFPFLCLHIRIPALVIYYGATATLFRIAKRALAIFGILP